MTPVANNQSNTSASEETVISSSLVAAGMARKGNVEVGEVVVVRELVDRE